MDIWQLFTGHTDFSQGIEEALPTYYATNFQKDFRKLFP